ncbi:MAG: DMT family transporter [Flavobacteriales bacterium]
MMTTARTSSLLLLHLIVFIWGFTGILGREISLDAFALVWWRVLVAAAAIGAYAFFFNKKLAAPSRSIAKFAAIGVLTAAHWVCFFASIKASNVSVALAVISTTSFFVSLVAPFVRNEKFKSYEVLLGLMVIAGLFIIFKFEMQYAEGIVLSLLASFFAAVFSSYNSKLIAEHTAAKIAFWEMLFALLAMSIFLVCTKQIHYTIIAPTAKDIWLLLLLGVACTGFAFLAGIEVMKVLSPFTCALTINLEPVYTIGFALWIYGESEYMSPQFYLGALIIISTLFINAWIKKRESSLRFPQ